MMLLEKSTLLDPWTSPHSAPTGCRRELERRARARSRIHPSPPLPDGGEKWTRRRLRLRVRPVRLRESDGGKQKKKLLLFILRQFRFLLLDFQVVCVFYSFAR